MNVFLAAGIVLVVTGAAIAVMLFVRRTAPDGSYFNDGDRASGVFGVLATGFSVLLGFIVFLAFTSYDTARAGAEAEALVLAQQVETAQFFPAPVAEELTGELICYGRSVAGPQWELMQSGKLGDAINPWGAAMFLTFQTIEPETASQEAAYGKWLDQTSAREAARTDRIHGAVGVIPGPLWLVLFAISAIIFAYMLFFADSGEGKLVQAMLMGSVAAVITMMLLLLQFLDDPFRDGFGGLKPVAMERTLDIIDQQLAVVGNDAPLPCDDRGFAS